MFNECRHIMPSGLRCKSPALKDKPFCYYHVRLHGARSVKGRPRKTLTLPSLEDAQGIQIALMQVLAALGTPALDNKRAGLYLYGLQIATQLAARVSPPAPRDVVRSVSTDEESGEALAPETVQCEPGAECEACAAADECVRPDRVAYVQARHLAAQALKDVRDSEQREREEGMKSPFGLLIEQWANEPQWVDPDADPVPESLSPSAP